MDPKLFGTGTWAMIFHMIYMFIFDLEQIKKLETQSYDLQTINRILESLTSVRINIQEDFISSSHTNNILIPNIKNNILELFKKRLSVVIDALPCNVCRSHSQNDLNVNKIFEQEDIFVILHFFIELRNSFYENKINREEFSTSDKIIRNKMHLFKIILNI